MTLTVFGRSVLKNICPRFHKQYSGYGLGKFLRPQANIFPVRTDQKW